MYSLFRPILFRLDPERAHALTLFALRISGGTPLLNWMIGLAYHAPKIPVSAFGLTFKNPVGLAAGYDKDALAVRGLSALGFGHIEIGTVTPLPQDGNPGPRVFRLIEDDAVINHMGFPSRGSEFVQGKLTPVQKISPIQSAIGVKPRRSSVVLGVNLGKNKATPNEEAVLDYLSLLQSFAPHADYLTINIS